MNLRDEQAVVPKDVPYQIYGLSRIKFVLRMCFMSRLILIQCHFNLLLLL